MKTFSKDDLKRNLEKYEKKDLSQILDTVMLAALEIL